MVRAAPDSDVRKAFGRHRRHRLGEEIDPLLLGPEPIEFGVRHDAVDHHQPLQDARRRHGPTEAAVGFADGAIQACVVQVVKPSAIVPAVADRREAEADELGEEQVHLVPVRDAGERRVPRHSVRASSSRLESDLSRGRCCCRADRRPNVHR